MKPQASIITELHEMAPHFPMVSPAMPHYVPEHYFDELSLQLLRQVAPGSSAAAVPDGYFDSLPLLLLQKVRQQEAHRELDEIAPLLNTLSKEPVGYVPPQYFERTITPPPHSRNSRTAGGAKVTLLRRLAPLAAAACLALGLWLGYGWYQQQAAEADTLAATPQIEEALKSLDDQTIASFLESTSASGAYTNPETNLDENVEMMLQDIQSETLEQYLNTMPTLLQTDKTDM